MVNVKTLALLVGMALLFILPATVSAQRVPPHVFVGTAKTDGVAAPNGTTVTAWVDGKQAATTTVTGGNYVITVDQGEASFAGKKVSFKVGANDAAQSGTWQQGGGDELNLTATAAAVVAPPPVVVAPPPVVAPAAVLKISLYEDNKSGQNGSATLTEVGDKTKVALLLSAGDTKSELAHIHAGQCGNISLGEVVYPLTSFLPAGSGGSNTPAVPATLASLRDGNHAINVHEAGKPGNYTACGNIPRPGAGQIDTRVALAPLTGPAGPAGAKGADGKDGAPGKAGADGKDGAPGKAGADGKPGAAGPAGAAGAAGEDGSSVIGIIAIIIAAIAAVVAGGAFLATRKKGAAS